MARYDVFRNSGHHAENVPYLLDMQSDLLEGLDTRVVVPLRRRDRFPSSQIPDRLMPAFDIEGVACLMETPKLAAVPTRFLKAPMASLADHQTPITNALDFLFQGY